MSLRRNVAVATIGNLAPPVLSLMTQPLLAQNLGVAGRGAVSAGVAPLMVAVSLCSLGLPESLNRFVATKSLGVRACVAILGLLGAVGATATFVIWSVADSLSAGSVDALSGIRVGALFVAPALIFHGLRGIAAGLPTWGSITVARFSQSLLLLLLVSYGAITETLTVIGAVAALALGQCAGAVVLGAAIVRRRHVLRSTDGAVTRQEFFGYGWNIWLGAASAYLLVRLDQLLMVPLSGIEQLGMYAVAVSISEAVLVVNAGLREVIFSAESAGRDPTRVGAVTRLSNLVVLLLACAAAVATPVLIGPLFGADFAEAVPMVMVLLAAAVMGNPGSVSGMALAAWGSPGLRSASVATALAVNVITILVLVPAYGGMGASIATLAGNVVAMVMILTSVRCVYGVPPRQFIVPTRLDLAEFARMVRKGR